MYENIFVGPSNTNIYCITKRTSCRFVDLDSRGWRSKCVSYRWSQSIMDSFPNGPRSHCTNPIEKRCSRWCCSVCKFAFISRTHSWKIQLLYIYQSQDGATALFKAAHKGFSAVVHELLKYKPNLYLLPVNWKKKIPLFSIFTAIEFHFCFVILLFAEWRDVFACSGYVWPFTSRKTIGSSW